MPEPLRVTEGVTDFVRDGDTDGVPDLLGVTVFVPETEGVLVRDIV